MKTTAKRGLMGTNFTCHNGARSLVSRNRKAEWKRRRWNPSDKRGALGE